MIGDTDLLEQALQLGDDGGDLVGQVIRVHCRHHSMSDSDGRGRGWRLSQLTSKERRTTAQNICVDTLGGVLTCMCRKTNHEEQELQDKQVASKVIC